jgi:hypothetical protein
VAGLLAAGFFLTAGSGRADIDKDLHASLSKIAAALEKGDSATAKAEAKTVAKKIEDLDDLMHSFKPRNKKGLGVGGTAGVVVPDGIEQKLNAISRDGITAAMLQKEAKNLTEAAWMTAAIAEITVFKAPEKDKGKKKRSKWIELSETTRDAAKELAAAAKGGNVNEVKNAAIKVNNGCNNCHMIFRE